MSWKKRLESTLVAAFVVGGMARNRNAPLRE
jgi:hypothetical protein